MTSFPDKWRYSNGWPLLPHRDLSDADVATIRNALPFGPLSFEECETHARSFGVHPRTIVNIATGHSFRRPSACPDGHPLRLALNEELAAKERLRYQAQKHRQAVGESQHWKCRYCGADISQKGQSALDHVVSVAKGGTSDPDNLQLLCRRCNIRKGDKDPGQGLDASMDRKTTRDRTIAKCYATLPAIIDALVWTDTNAIDCRWCHSKTKRIDDDPSVFRCTACKRMFRSGGFDEKADFYSALGDAVYGRWYATGRAKEVIGAVMGGNMLRVRSLAEVEAGQLQEVKRRRHNHKDPKGCWCEYGGGDFDVVQTYHQSETLQPCRPPCVTCASAEGNE